MSVVLVMFPVIFFLLTLHLSFKFPRAIFPYYLSTAIGEKIMSKVCEVTGRRPSRGYKYAIRGIAKKQKGIGLKVTGKTKRRFQPNLIKKRFWFADENRFITLKLSTAAMRTIDRLGIASIVRDMRARGQSV